jgi:hypothetical protein
MPVADQGLTKLQLVTIVTVPLSQFLRDFVQRGPAWLRMSVICWKF